MRRSLLVVLAVSIVVATCGSAVPSVVPASDAPGPDAPGRYPSTADMLAEVREATVRFEVTSELRLPGEALATPFDGDGSGFLITTDGLAVTDYHVVAGATTMTAFVAGSPRGREAELVSASECNDLAVVRIADAPDASLDWYEGPIRVGLDVILAGYPLGEPQFTATRGIVAKVGAAHASEWASPTGVFEHDADQREGSSGAPLLTLDGRVVGVAYSGTDDGRNYAIDRDTGRSTVETLAEGDLVGAIGIYGESYRTGALAGVWVSEVRAGSPADRAGLRPGDVITELGGVAASDGGTVAGLCQTVHARGDEALRVRVVRLDEDEELEAVLGEGRLERVTAAMDYGQDGRYRRFDEATDASGRVRLDVPTAWGDRDGEGWYEADVEHGPSMAVAPDLDAYYETWDAPGLFAGWSERLLDDFTPEAYATWLYDGCEPIDAVPRSVAGVRGTLFSYGACDPDDESEHRLFVAGDAGRLIVVEGQLLAEADIDAFERALRSLRVDPPRGG